MRTIATCIVLMALLQSCYHRFEAEPFDPRIPAYTEKGNNDAAAYIDGEPWIASTIYSPWSSPSFGIRFQYTQDTLARPFETRLSLTNGRILNADKYVRIDAVFRLYGLRITNGQELKALEGRKFEFNTEEAAAELWVDFYSPDRDTLRSEKGALYIRYVENRTNPETTIISGTFGFETMAEDSLVRMTSGRFDFRLDPTEYYPL